MNTERVMLDHAATTAVRSVAADAVAGVLADHALGNPASLHREGRAARRALEEARESVAASLRARPTEVLFTSGATESLNLAVKGLAWSARAKDPNRRRVVVSAVEHHAVLDAARWMAVEQGYELTVLPPDPQGRVHPADLLEHHDDIAVVAVMHANNETGAINDMVAWSRACDAAGAPLVIDAAQTVGQLDVGFDDPGVSAVAVSGHKVGGPPGSGALLLRSGMTMVPLLHGGGQEREVRSGTVSVALAAGLAAAVNESVVQRVPHAARLEALRQLLVAEVRAAVPDAVVHGPEQDHLPGVASIGFPGTEGDALLMLLDAAGIACSLGSACTAGVPEPSHVLLAMGVEPALARGSLRFSLGWTSTERDVERLAAALPTAVERARRAAAAAAAGQRR